MTDSSGEYSIPIVHQGEFSVHTCRSAKVGPRYLAAEDTISSEANPVTCDVSLVQGNDPYQHDVREPDDTMQEPWDHGHYIGFTWSNTWVGYGYGNLWVPDEEDWLRAEFDDDQSASFDFEARVRAMSPQSNYNLFVYVDLGKDGTIDVVASSENPGNLQVTSTLPGSYGRRLPSYSSP